MEIVHVSLIKMTTINIMLLLNIIKAVSGRGEQKFKKGKKYI